MKNISKKLIICMVSIFTLCSTFRSYSLANTSKKEETENFNFIKSEEDTKNFIYDGSILLYGGVILISISVSGIVFTLWPSKKRKKSNKK